MKKKRISVLDIPNLLDRPHWEAVGKALNEATLAVRIATQNEVEDSTLLEYMCSILSTSVINSGSSIEDVLASIAKLHGRLEREFAEPPLELPEGGE